MAKKPTRLRFTEDDLADSQVKKLLTVRIKRLTKQKKRWISWLPKEGNQAASGNGCRRFPESKAPFRQDRQQRGCGSPIFGKTACHPWHGCDTQIQGASGGIGV